jgi:two-component system, NarL family, invasion response regulator UvrY
MLKILLIDDHSIITTGLWLILNKEYPGSIIDVANTGESAFSFIKSENYDLVTLDLNMPDVDTTNILSQIKIRNENSKVLIFSMQPEEVFAKRMYSLGANGYINKTASDSEILKAVSSVLNGISYVSDKFIQKMTDDLINKRSSNPFDKLSKREFEITILLIKGFSMSKISEVMNLHSSTVGTYKAKVFEKIGVDNVIDLKESAELFSISAI